LRRDLCERIPRPLKPGDKDENAAFSTPLSITGSPAELDQELPRQLVEFVGAHLQLAISLESAKELMAAATKAARDSEHKATPAKAAIPPTAAAVNDNLGLEDT
jgi:PRTRC genetic system protein E